MLKNQHRFIRYNKYAMCNINKKLIGLRNHILLINFNF